MTQKSGRAAAIIWHNWQRLTRIDELPADCRPADRLQGYAAQADVVRMSGQKIVGWKIAATSLAGQKHIGVDGPLAGPLLSHRVLRWGGWDTPPPPPRYPRVSARSLPPLGG